MTLVGALVRDHGCGRAAVDRKKALADGLTVGVCRRHGDRVAAEVAVGRDARDHAGVRVDVEAGRQGGGERQGIIGRRSYEMAGDVQGERMAVIGALVRDSDGSRGRTAAYGSWS